MNTLFFGQHIIKLDEIGSTNNYTSEFLRHNVMQEGAVVLAKSQVSGKGQRGNVWQSNPNENLTFSVFIKPNFIPIANQFILNKWVSISLVEMLSDFGINTKIKWPNDIYAGNKKIAGILIENSVSSKINHSIVGIGLNVNQLDFNELPHAISMRNQTSKHYNLEVVLACLCKKLEQNYLKLKAGISVLNNVYLDNLYRFNVPANYKDINGKFVGKTIGISPTGELQIEREGGVKSYVFKEVEFLI